MARPDMLDSSAASRTPAHALHALSSFCSSLSLPNCSGKTFLFASAASRDRAIMSSSCRTMLNISNAPTKETPMKMANAYRTPHRLSGMRRLRVLLMCPGSVDAAENGPVDPVQNERGDWRPHAEMQAEESGAGHGH